ncbi:mannosyltransferase family protein [Planktothrix tepida]|nr:mannosyltransferase family protein [Planktothrix tepida]
MKEQPMNSQKVLTQLFAKLQDFLTKIAKICQSNGIIFALTMGVLSRSIILLTFFAIAFFSPVSSQWGWEVFSAWDSPLYQIIATSGYEVINQTEPGGNVAFFPLFPLLIRGLMNLGLPFEVAGVLINNLAFFGALILLYQWVEITNNSQAARWATAILAWCPLSIFGTVIYTEGLFLFLSIAALKAFDLEKYPQVILWGSLATATRITGIALIPAFLITAWQKRKPAIAYLSGLLSGCGLLFYSLYCWIKFNNPIAFITVQHTQWQRQTGFDSQGWLKMIMQILIGSQNWKKGTIVDPWHPFLVIILAIIGYLLWRYRDQLGEVKFDYSFCFLLFILWLIAGDPLLNTSIILGSGYLLWYLRYELSLVAVNYGFCALGLLLASGGTISLSRLAYGIVSVSLALGVMLSHHRRWGYVTLGFFTLLLISFSVRFAQHLWVA